MGLEKGEQSIFRGAKFFWGRGWAEPLMSAWHAGPVLVLQDKSLDIVCHLDAKNTFFLEVFYLA